MYMSFKFVFNPKTSEGKIKKLFLVTCFFVFPFLLMGQSQQTESLKIKAGINLSGFFQSGNVETTILRAKSNIVVKPLARWSFQNENSYVYQEFGKQKADTDVLSLNFVRYNMTKKITPFVLSFFSTNFRRQIDYRYLVGVGGTYNVLDSNHHLFKLSLSSEYERTNFLNSDFNVQSYDGVSKVTTFRGTLWLYGKHSWFQKKVILSHETYFQPSLQERDNFRWQTDVTLEFPIWKYLSVTVNYRHAYEGIVIQNEKQQDDFLTFGLELKNY